MRSYLTGSALLILIAGTATVQQAAMPEGKLIINSINLGTQNRDGAFENSTVGFALIRPAPAPAKTTSTYFNVPVGAVRSSDDAEAKGRQELKVIADELKRLADQPPPRR